MAIRIDDIELGITHDSKDAVHSVEELENALKRLKVSFGGFGNKSPTKDITALTTAIKSLSTMLGGDIIGRITSFSTALESISQKAGTVGASIRKLAKDIAKAADVKGFQDSVEHVLTGVELLSNAISSVEPGNLENLASAFSQLGRLSGTFGKLALDLKDVDVGSVLYNLGFGVREVTAASQELDLEKITALASMMRDLRTAVSGFSSEKVSGGATALFEAIEKFSGMKPISKAVIKSIMSLATAIDRLAASYERLKKAQKGVKLKLPSGGGAGGSDTNTDGVDGSSSGGKGSWIDKLRDKFASLRHEGRRTDSEIRKIGKSSEKAGKRGTSAFGKLFSSLKRIAMYRLIRSAFSAIGKSIKEGTQNLYQWSKLQKDTTGNKFAQSMDKAASSLLYLKNGIGVAIAPLIEALIPALEKIVNKVVDFVNKISELNAALNGESTFVKAKYLDIEYGAEDATKANEKLKKSLLGFDEINALSDNSSSSDSKDTAKDYSKMFETAKTQMKIPSWVTNLKDTVVDLGAKLKLDFSEGLEDITNWGDLTGEDVAEKVLDGLILLVAGVTGFSIAGVPGAVIATLGAIALIGKINKGTFDDDGKLSKQEVLETLVPVLTTLFGAVVGFTIGGKEGAIIGSVAGLVLGLAVDKAIFDEDKSSKMSEDEVAKLVSTAILFVTGSVIGGLIGGATGVAVGGTVGVLFSLWADKAIFDKDGSKKMTAYEVTTLLGTMAAAVTGGIIGGVAGGAVGAGIGATIGLSLSLTVASLIPDEKAQEFNDWWFDTKTKAKTLSLAISILKNETFEWLKGKWDDRPEWMKTFELTVSTIVGDLFQKVVDFFDRHFGDKNKDEKEITLNAKAKDEDGFFTKVRNWFDEHFGNKDEENFTISLKATGKPETGFEKILGWIEKLANFFHEKNEERSIKLNADGESTPLFDKISEFWHKIFGTKDGDKANIEVKADGESTPLFDKISEFWHKVFGTKDGDKKTATAILNGEDGDDKGAIRKFWDKITGKDGDKKTVTGKLDGMKTSAGGAFEAFWNKITGKDGDKKTVTATLNGTDTGQGSGIRSFWTNLKNGSSKSAKVGLSWTDKSSSIRTWFSNRTKGTSAPVTAKWKDKAADNPVRKWFVAKAKGITASVKAKWNEKDNTTTETRFELAEWVSGITTKVQAKWKDSKAKAWFDGLLDATAQLKIELTDKVTKAIQSALVKIRDAINKAIEVINKLPGVDIEELGKFKFETYATGGLPAYGSMFIAGEPGAGVELVGTINGRTGVASQGEITGIADAVRESSDREARLLTALIGAVESSGNGEVVISTSSLTNALARNNRRMGRTVSAVGT